MRKPDGTIDLIGGGMNLVSQVIGLVTEFAPDKKQRKINVAIRRLKHRFKSTPVDVYVKVNFSEYTLEAQQEITTYIKSALNQPIL